MSPFESHYLPQKFLISSNKQKLSYRITYNVQSGSRLRCRRSAPALRLRLVLSMAASHIKPFIPCLMHNILLHWSLNFTNSPASHSSQSQTVFTIKSTGLIRKLIFSSSSFKKQNKRILHVVFSHSNFCKGKILKTFLKLEIKK